MHLPTKYKINNSPEYLINIHIKSTLKNTLVSIKQKDFLLLQISSKSLPKVKNQKSNNFYTLKELSKEIINVIKKKGCTQLRIYIKGTGMGRNIIIRALSYKFSIISIHDLTPIPFNGCRPKKQKRR